jgi:hypothetical protein
MKKILILLVMCTCVFACSKDDDGSSPDSRNAYKPGDIVTVDETEQ